MTTITERVARGAAFLDHAKPGWRDAITPTELAMQEACKCVCGQVFATNGYVLEDGWPQSGYDYALEHYATNADWAYEHGFTTRHSYWGDTRDAEYALLRAAWLHAIHTPTETPAELVTS